MRRSSPRWELRRGPRKRQAELPGPAARPVGAQQVWAHPEARRKRRGHVMERRAAIAAVIIPDAFDAEPVAARRAFRIQALHCPSREILHTAPFESRALAAARREVLVAEPGEAPGKVGGIVLGRG